MKLFGILCIAMSVSLLYIGFVVASKEPLLLPPMIIMTVVSVIFWGDQIRKGFE